MSIRRIRRSVLIAAGIGLLAAGGLFAGKLLAGSLRPANSSELVPRAGQCGVASSANAVVLNVTITQPMADGHLRLYPGSTGTAPLVSTINFRTGQTRANNAIVSLGPGGTLALFLGSSGPTHCIMDISGYFE